MSKQIQIVAFLQNQWFKDPVKAREVFARNPALREKLLARYLFAGCLTGRRLREAFGELCDQIVWEEISTQIGGHAASKFPADPLHIARVISKHNPDIVLAFGKIAAAGVYDVLFGMVDLSEIRFISGPHPAARKANVIAELRRVANQVTGYLACH